MFLSAAVEHMLLSRLLAVVPQSLDVCDMGWDVIAVKF